MIDKIIALLEQLKEVYSKLYDMSKKKQEYIIANEAQHVSDLIKEEWHLMEDATRLEDERNSLVLSLLQGKEEETSIQEIIKVANPGQQAKLVDISDELKGIIEKQKRINAENQSLIEFHLEYMEYMINTVLKEPDVSSIYGNTGTVDDSGIDNRSILDSEA